MDDGAGGETPGAVGLERALAQDQYDFARTRYVRAVTGDGVARVIERAALRRAKMRGEIDQLRALARTLHDEAIASAREYGRILPHRVGTGWIQPPDPLEKLGAFAGAQRLYKQAVRATKDYIVVRDRLVKRRAQLIAMEADLRVALEVREAALLRQLDSPRSLQTALARDPLLNIAYQKLKAFQADLSAASPAEGGGDF